MGNMSLERFNQLMMADDVSLTQAEMRDGWHFCPDFDYLLTKFGAQPVLRECTCEPWTDSDIQDGAS